MKSSRRPSGASRIGAFHFWERFVTQIGEANAMLVTLEEGVHENPSVVRYLEAYNFNAFFGQTQTLNPGGISRAIKGEALA